MVLVVAYDLHDPGRIYPRVEAELKKADGGWAHVQGSVWFIDSQSGPDVWRDRVEKVLDSNDEVFVGRLAHQWASHRVEKQYTDWLKDPSRTW